MLLFDSKVRTDPTVSSGLESTFQFLDRVRSPFFREVREALKRWVAGYPEDEQEELVSRLRAGTGSFRDAFWELWLYTAYRGAGFEVDVHPPVPGSENRPDFAVHRGDFSAYLEARVATGASAQSVAKENLLSSLYKAFNTASHPDFRLALSVEHEGAQQPNAKVLRRGVMQWLEGLDVESVAHLGPFSLPEHEQTLQGWTFRFTALPLAEEKRGMSRTPFISVHPGGSFIGDAGAAFRKALKHKGRRYGPAADPLIIAVQVEEPWTDIEDLESALHGRTSQHATRTEDGISLSEVERLDDGYWSASSGRRVAAVLTSETINPWTVQTARPSLWTSPFRTSELAHPRIWQTGTLEPDRKSVSWVAPTEGAATEWFGVPDDWPNGVRFPS